MRPVCPTWMARGRRVADLRGDVPLVPGNGRSESQAGAGGVLRYGGERAPPAAPSGIIARVSGIYEEPELYQLACAYRDVPAEVTALLAWCGEHSREEVQTVLELAAGPAEHALELARRGLSATALDKSAAMSSR